MILSTTKLTDKILVHVGLFIHEVCLTFLNCAFLSLKKTLQKCLKASLKSFLDSLNLIQILTADISIKLMGLAYHPHFSVLIDITFKPVSVLTLS